MRECLPMAGSNRAQGAGKVTAGAPGQMKIPKDARFEGLRIKIPLGYKVVQEALPILRLPPPSVDRSRWVGDW